MENKTSSVEYEILGYKVRLREEEASTSSSPNEVVDFVRDEANKIMDRAPHLERGEVALLLALQLAEKNMRLENQYQTEVSQLKEKASQALDLIEEVTPSTM